MTFQKMYLVKFVTKDGQWTSVVVGAFNASCAQDIVREMPQFDSFVGYPEEISIS